jgi:hypothetical protein
MKSTIFWDIKPLVRWKSTDVSQEHFGSILSIKEYAKQETSVKQAASRVKMEAKYSSETSVDFQRITWHYIPGDILLQQYSNVFRG